MRHARWQRGIFRSPLFAIHHGVQIHAGGGVAVRTLCHGRYHYVLPLSNFCFVDIDGNAYGLRLGRLGVPRYARQEKDYESYAKFSKAQHE